MKKTDVVVCDDCKKTIADRKCELCEKDLCEDCMGGAELRINEVTFNGISLCSDCEEKVNNLFHNQEFEVRKEMFDDKNEIKNKITSILKKNLMLKQLQSGKNKK